jgi:hypothetical protein
MDRIRNSQARSAEPDIRVVGIRKKDGELYVFLFCDTDEQRCATMRILGRYASDPDLSFTWYDAAHLSLTIRDR